MDRVTRDADRNRPTGRRLVIALLAVASIPLCGIVLALWSVAAGSRPYTIPSASMLPTLHRGDYLWAGPAPTEANLRRGDVVVFVRRDASGRDLAFIQRVVGLPGDRIQMVDGAPVINGVAAAQTPISDYVEPLREGPPLQRCVEAADGECRIRQAVETLPGGPSYRVLDLDGPAGQLDNTPEIRVPEGMVFLLGDNRDNALDSRFQTLNRGENPPRLDQLRHRGGRVIFNTRGRADRFGVSIAPEPGPRGAETGGGS